MIMELSLHSGAEYEVFILVHVKDDTPIHTDEESVRRLKDKYIPSEFHDMAILFNDKMLETWYPNVMQHKYDSSPQAQVFQMRTISHPFIGPFSSISSQCKYSRRPIPTSTIIGNLRWIPDTLVTCIISSTE